MAVGIIGKKLGMTQLFDIKGHLVPITVIQAGPCPVVQKKTLETDGYTAVQIGFQEIDRKKIRNKPIAGHFKRAGVKPTKVLKEFRVSDTTPYEVGQKLDIDFFKPTERVTITGISKGRGYAGVIKRHGFAGKDLGHGSHEAFRHGGSIGCRTPKHTIRGMKMAGRMGGQKFTIKNLKVVFVDKDNNLLLIKGSVPGWKGGYVFVRKAEGR